MRIPACHILDRLPVGEPVVLRGADLRTLINSQVPYTDAVSLVVRGEVEGVGTRAGRIKYLRQLPLNERPIPAPSEDAMDHTESNSTIIARTNLGVYREFLGQTVALNPVAPAQAMPRFVPPSFAAPAAIPQAAAPPAPAPITTINLASVPPTPTGTTGFCYSFSLLRARRIR